MGVRGLISFIKQSLSSVSERKRLNSEHKQIIVVDGNAFTYWLFGKFSSDCVADYYSVHSYLCQLLQGFLRENIQTIFVFDGIHESDKLPCKINRLTSQAQALRNGSGDYSPFSSFPIPLLAIEMVIETLLFLSSFQIFDDVIPSSSTHLFFLAPTEADKCIFSLAKKCGAIGILSNDSDMLIYSTSMDDEISLIPLWNFEPQQLECITQINREKLSRLLQVPPKDMWLLAALLGCDQSDSDLLNSLHIRLQIWSKGPQRSQKYQSQAVKKKFKSKQQTSSFSQSPQGTASGFPVNQRDPFIMPALETIKIVTKLISNTKSKYQKNPDDELLTYIVANLFNSDPLDIYRATNRSPCDGRNCQESVAKPVNRNDWEVDNVLVRKWSYCCSNTSNEIRRLVRYFMMIKSQYQVADEETLFSSSYQRLHLDLQQVLSSNLFLPRVSHVENRLFQGKSPLGGVYDRLSPLRDRIYHLLSHLKKTELIETETRVPNLIQEMIFQCGKLKIKSRVISDCSQDSFRDLLEKGDFTVEHIDFLVGIKLTRLLDDESDFVTSLRLVVIVLHQSLEVQSINSQQKLSICMSFVISFCLSISVGSGEMIGWTNIILGEVNFVSIWSCIEVAFQHAQYIFSIISQFTSSSKQKKIFLPIHNLNLPFFCEVLSIISECSLHQLHQLLNGLLLDHIFPRFFKFFELSQFSEDSIRNAFNICHQVLDGVIDQSPGSVYHIET